MSFLLRKPWLIMPLIKSHNQQDDLHNPDHLPSWPGSFLSDLNGLPNVPGTLTDLYCQKPDSSSLSLEAPDSSSLSLEAFSIWFQCGLLAYS